MAHHAWPPCILASSAGSPSVVLLSKRGMLSYIDAVAAAVVPAEAAYAGAHGGGRQVRSAAVVSNFVTSSSSVQSSERVPGFDNAIAMPYF
eukprot:363597-Chlamydomonas_euryale.AAC.8